MIRKTLGHYQYPAQIGKGGMGEMSQGKLNQLSLSVIVMPTALTFTNNAR
jgi:hypothetical protein